MHAAAADNGVVKTLDLLVAEIHMKHSQIFIADSSSTATGPSSSVQKLSETNGKVISPNILLLKSSENCA